MPCHLSGFVKDMPCDVYFLASSREQMQTCEGSMDTNATVYQTKNQDQRDTEKASWQSATLGLLLITSLCA